MKDSRNHHGPRNWTELLGMQVPISTRIRAAPLTKKFIAQNLISLMRCATLPKYFHIETFDILFLHFLYPSFMLKSNFGEQNVISVSII